MQATFVPHAPVTAAPGLACRALCWGQRHTYQTRSLCPDACCWCCSWFHRHSGLSRQQGPRKDCEAKTGWGWLVVAKSSKREGKTPMSSIHLGGGRGTPSELQGEEAALCYHQCPVRRKAGPWSKMSWCLSCAPPRPSALNSLCLALLLLLLLLEHMLLCIQCQGDFVNKLCTLLVLLDVSPSRVGGQLEAQAWAQARLQRSCSVAQAERMGRVPSLKAPPERRAAILTEASHSVFSNTSLIQDVTPAPVVSAGPEPKESRPSQG